MTDDALAAGLVDAARRAVEHAQDEPPEPHGDPLAGQVPTEAAPKPSSQLRSEALGEAPEGDHRGGTPPRRGGVRPALTITEAARAADVDRRTIRRKLDSGALPHAYREGGDGAWRIPVGDLLAAGYRLHAPDAPPDDSDGPARGPAPPPPEVAELAEWRRRAEVAEALASERERTIRALELALRALEPGPAPVVVPMASAPEPAGTPDPPAAPARRRWWQRA